MLNQAQIDEFNRNGFLNGGRVLSDEELGRIERRARRNLGQRPRWLCLPVRRSRYPSAT